MEGTYLNVNMAHEFWRDADNEIFHAYDPPASPWWQYALFALAISNVINQSLYVLVRIFQSIFYSYSDTKAKSS